MEGDSSLTDNVFINCPFDPDYRPMFYAIIFTVHNCGFLPRCALEESKEDIVLKKIERIIKECRYGIHDISRVELDTNTGYPRFNMPFELGLFLGCKRYFDKKKKILILDVDRYRYRSFISDIAGMAVKGHNNDPIVVIRLIRNWLRKESGREIIPSASEIVSWYQEFMGEKQEYISEISSDEDDFAFVDYSTLVSEWLDKKING